MEGKKKWFKSKTIMNAIAAIGALFVGMTGALVVFINAIRPGTVTETELQTLQEKFPAITGALAAILVSGFSIWKVLRAIIGRFEAKDEIG